MKLDAAENVGPSCKCGYFFAVATAIRKRPFSSFAIVNDRHYPRFLKAEDRALKAETPTEKLRALGRSSKLVGSILEFPDCGRLLILKPGEGPREDYVRG